MPHRLQGCPVNCIYILTVELPIDAQGSNNVLLIPTDQHQFKY